MTAQTVTQEVIDLHQFLEDWLKGAIPKGNGQPERLADVLAEDFSVIHPNGSRANRATAIQNFAAAYGEKPDEYALQISDIRVRLLTDHLALATYVEGHRGEAGRERICTALMRLPRAGQLIQWLFLQETLIA